MGVSVGWGKFSIGAVGSINTCRVGGGGALGLLLRCVVVSAGDTGGGGQQGVDTAGVEKVV